MSCYAFRLAPCDLGDPGSGDPWFPHGAVLLPSPACMALCESVFSLFGLCLWPYHNDMTQCCQAAAFSCSKFVFSCLTPFSASKCCFLHLFIFPHRLCVFFPPPVIFHCIETFERTSRFFTVHICLNPFNLLDFFHWQKVGALPFSSSLSQELLEVLIFAKSGKN